MNVRNVLPALVLALALPAAVTAQDTGTFQQALLNDVATLEQKLVGLAEAVPAEDYGWAPSDEVRSVGRVYAHVAGANMMLPGMFGYAAPTDMGIENPPQNPEEVTDKAQIVAMLKASFPHVREVISGTSDADLDREINLFGQPATVRDFLVLLVTHMHEHLGQSIAYARSVGVTPPWSG